MIYRSDMGKPGWANQITGPTAWEDRHLTFFDRAMVRRVWLFRFEANGIRIASPNEDAIRIAVFKYLWLPCMGIEPIRNERRPAVSWRSDMKGLAMKFTTPSPRLLKEDLGYVANAKRRHFP